MAAALVAGCAHPGPPTPPVEPGATLRPVAWSDLPADPAADDLPLGPLAEAAARTADLVEKARGGALRFGDRRVARPVYAAALRRFADLARRAATSAELRAAAERELTVYEAVFAEPLLVTAYYEPVIEGARARAGRFSQPLYRRPDGLLDEQHPGPSRAEIDSGGALAGRGLELCYVDPLDAFVLQVEGSGVVSLDDGSTLALDFAATNGRPYVRLASLLGGRIPAGQMNMHTIEAYLRTLPEPELRAWLEKNPRYVFFQPRNATASADGPAGAEAFAGPATSLGLRAVDGRVIATDPRWVPKGALAFLVTEVPAFDPPAALVPARWVPLSRFVVDADTGGGIKGARVDLFWGRGAPARLVANAMKRRGRLFYFAPRAE